MRTIILSLKKRLPILLLLVLPYSSLKAQCFNSGWQNATIFTVDNSVGDYDFSAPDNAETSNNLRATAASLISILTGDTYYLKATGFNFNIPSYASICGVIVEIESRATGLILTAAVRDNDVRIIKNGSNTGTNNALSGDWGSSDAYHSYGGASDLWGTTLTPADVNASNFGVAIQVRLIALVAALPTAQIDHIRMNIVYNPILPVSLAWFKAEKKSGSVQLSWKTTEEEDEALIMLQRSSGNGEWREIQRYELHSSNSNMEYSYIDIISSKSELQYRLCTILPSGRKTYSATRNISATAFDRLVVYPNPAKNTITCNTDKGIITDMGGRRSDIPSYNNGNGFVMQVSHLPPGVYFIRNEKEVIKLIKE